MSVLVYCHRLSWPKNAKHKIVLLVFLQVGPAVMPEPNDGINKLRVHRQMLHWHQPDFTGTWNENNQKQDATFCNLRLVTIQRIVRITWEDKSICRLSINDISTEYTPTIHHTGSLKSQNSWSKRPKFGAASSTKIGEGNLLGLSREEWSAIHCCTVLVGFPPILAEVTQPCNTRLNACESWTSCWLHRTIWFRGQGGDGLYHPGRADIPKRLLLASQLPAKHAK